MATARTDGSYMSASDGRVHVGLGNQPHIDQHRGPVAGRIDESFTGVGADRIVTLRRATGQSGGRCAMTTCRGLDRVDRGLMGASAHVTAQEPEIDCGPREPWARRHAGVALRRGGRDLRRTGRSEARRWRIADESRDGALHGGSPSGSGRASAEGRAARPALAPASLFLGASLLDLGRPRRPSPRSRKR